MANRKEKQEKFSAPKKNNTLIYVAIGVFLIAGVAASVFFTQGSSKSEAATFNTGAPVTYGQSIEMTDITNTVAAGKVAINLDEVKKAGIVYTEYNQGGKKLALTSWVSPLGNLVAAVSLCEPCRGVKFHIEGKELVCNTCGTRWTLDGLNGVSGGCLKYAPDKLKYEVKDGKILMDETQIQAWQPRV